MANAQQLHAQTRCEGLSSHCMAPHAVFTLPRASRHCWLRTGSDRNRTALYSLHAHRPQSKYSSRLTVGQLQAAGLTDLTEGLALNLPDALPCHLRRHTWLASRGLSASISAHNGKHSTYGGAWKARWRRGIASEYASCTETPKLASPRDHSAYARLAENRVNENHVG